MFNFLRFFIILPIISKINSETCKPAYSYCNLGITDQINVHLVPHTHNDLGWLKTVDQYYLGSQLDSDESKGVQYILDTVINELNNDLNKRFVYVEIGYFYIWWQEQTNQTKQIVKQLVQDHRFEFVIGGWCMNDEATTYYSDIIDQQTLGLRFILDEFGDCARPRSAWQIDPFGHSREQASLFAQFGFDGLFLGRIDYQDKFYRGKTKTREFLWQASRNFDSDYAQLFTGVLHSGYKPPSEEFCFDQMCRVDPIIDDERFDDYNVDRKVDNFLNLIYDQNNYYRTNHLIVTMGADFHYTNAHMYFKNLDKLIYHVNKRQVTNNTKVNLFYSTTECYLYAINQANLTWNVKYVK